MIVALLFACGGGDPVKTAPAVVWDREACDHCGMLVSEPRFAVQLVTMGGTVQVFDDPACLVRDIADESPAIARLWFRDSTAATDVWLSETQVAFTPATGTPMNGGYGAVPLGAAGAIGFGEMSSRILEMSK